MTTVRAHLLAVRQWETRRANAVDILPMGGTIRANLRTELRHVRVHPNLPSEVA